MSNYSYNTQISKFNTLLEQNKLNNAQLLLDELRLTTLFSNKEIENRYQLLALKLSTRKPVNVLSVDNESEIIISSFLNNKYFHTPFVNKMLPNAIINYPNSDSLIYVYELLKTQAINRKLNPTYVSYRSQDYKWNEAEALQLLDMMKKNEKLLL